jgi:threonine/homoserine/homoserine lactone efflux protein
MSSLVHILLGVILSFIGSIPFGTINVTVLESAITRGFRAAFWVVIGAAIIEFLQALISLKFSELLTRNPVTEQIILWLSIPIFIALGIYFLRQRRVQAREVHGYSHRKGFLKGVIVSALNVLAIPYWIFYGTYLTSIAWIDPSQDINILLFSLGVLAGTITILLTYARLGIYAQAKFSKITHYITPGVAIFLFVLAGVQVVRMVFY